MEKNKKIGKTSKQLERHMKGISNHHRISILLLLCERPNLTLENIAETLSINLKTASGHTQKLVQAGLLNKNYKGLSVEHKLSPYGKRITDFLISFSYSRE